MKKPILLILIFFSLISCKKNENSGPQAPAVNPPGSPENFAKNFGSPAFRDFIIQVVDATNNSVPAADIKIGGSAVQTDANGIAVLKNAGVYEQFAYITVKKNGFIDGSRALLPSTGINKIKVILLRDNVIVTVNSGVSSNVSLPNGTKVSFDGGFKTETGTSYTGAVSVILNSLAASDPNLFYKMPGMLYAQNSNGDPKSLETYGMMNVELRGAGGQKLQITNKAQIEMNITSGQLSIAPLTIPLWHFDEVLGYWKEEGMATKVGNKYVGEVSHFSWWNFDMPMPPANVYLQIKLVDAGNNPLANVKTVLVRAGSPSHISYTEGNGTTGGAVPKNEVLTLNVYDHCGNIVHTQNIGPFTTATVLPDIVLNIPPVQNTTISGTLKKCNNSNVTNGYVIINYGQENFVAMVTNGTFSFQTIICGSNVITVTGEDLDNHQNTGTLNYTLTSPSTAIGNILACNTSAESITYSIDGGPLKTITSNITASSSANSFTISANTPGQLNGIIIDGNTIIPGTYTSGFQIQGNGLSNNINPVFNLFNMTYNLTNVGGVGQYIDVVFSGTYQEVVMTGMSQSYNLTHTITGTAHVIRDN